MAQFEGKIAVVAGGTQGLGAAIARLFADRGASGLVICGHSHEKEQAKAREIQEATGAEVEFVAADFGQVEDCRAVIARADGRFGRIDALVNAAAITDRRTILDTSPELFDRLSSTNVRRPFFLIQDAIKVMRRGATKEPSLTSAPSPAWRGSFSSRPIARPRARWRH